jgi:hypothetical protein
MGGIAKVLWVSIPIAVIHANLTIILIMPVAVAHDEFRLAIETPYFVIYK